MSLSHYEKAILQTSGPCSSFVAGLLTVSGPFTLNPFLPAMALSVTLLQTRFDCDKVLTNLTELENTLSFNQLRIQRAKDAAIKRATALGPGRHPG